MSFVANAASDVFSKNMSSLFAATLVRSMRCTSQLREIEREREKDRYNEKRIKTMCRVKQRNSSSSDAIVIDASTPLSRACTLRRDECKNGNFI